MLRPLRPLTDEEKDFVYQMAQRKGKGWRRGDEVAYLRRGDFTICVLKEDGKLLFGVAKRNPIDKHNPDRAHKIALARAVEGVPMEL